MTLLINAAFDGGNIRVLGIEGDQVDLAIVADHGSDFFQWFYFRVAGARGQTLTFRIRNANAAAYPFGWPGYRTRMSDDRQAWRMIDTAYADGVLTFTAMIDRDLAWFAYFAPYTMEMHHALVARSAAKPGVAYRELGQKGSMDSRSIIFASVRARSRSGSTRASTRESR